MIGSLLTVMFSCLLNPLRFLIFLILALQFRLHVLFLFTSFCQDLCVLAFYADCSISSMLLSWPLSRSHSLPICSILSTPSPRDVPGLVTGERGCQGCRSRPSPPGPGSLGVPPRRALRRRGWGCRRAGLPGRALPGGRRAAMLLVLSEEQKAHLGCLPPAGAAAVGELGRLAVELLRRGAAPRACEAAARKLNIGVDTVQHGVEGLTYLLTESSKLMISEIDFQDSINVLGFSDELNKLLLQLYLDNRKEIRSILSELAPKLPSYHNLEWRLDVQLASRSLRQQIKPAVTIKLHLIENEDETAQVLQTDPATLLHLIQQLEQALGEMKTNHCRRIVRNMK